MLIQEAISELPVWKEARILFVCALAFVTVSCTTFTRKDSSPLRTVEFVAVESLGASGELKARFGVDPGDSNVEVGIVAGAGTGSVIAAGTALSCGPFLADELVADAVIKLVLADARFTRTSNQAFDSCVEGLALQMFRDIQF